MGRGRYKSVLEMVREQFPEDEPEKVIIKKLLAHNGHQAKAAAELGVSQSALSRYLNYNKVSI